MVVIADNKENILDAFPSFLGRLLSNYTSESLVQVMTASTTSSTSKTSRNGSKGNNGNNGQSTTPTVPSLSAFLTNLPLRCSDIKTFSSDVLSGVSDALNAYMLENEPAALMTVSDAPVVTCNASESQMTLTLPLVFEEGDETALSQDTLMAMKEVMLEAMAANMDEVVPVGDVEAFSYFEGTT